jgi:hypothetical protein
MIVTSEPEGLCHIIQIPPAYAMCLLDPTRGVFEQDGSTSITYGLLTFYELGM